jgi:WD40 repeat protein
MPLLSRSVSLQDLIADGTTIHPHEAVTIVQQVCRYLAWKSSLDEPIRVPPIDQIRVDAAGEAVITELKPAATPVTVADLARLLEALLPPPGRSQRQAVPGPLRFTIARAIADVDARPFTSVADFCTALARFELEPSRQAIGALFDRWRTSRAGAAAAPAQTPAFVDGPWVMDGHGFRERRQSDVAEACGVLPPARVERRRRGPRADTFRVLLREADRQLFEAATKPEDRGDRAVRGIGAAPLRDRRERTPDAATFRRLLREADQLAYERRVAAEADGAEPAAGISETRPIPVAAEVSPPTAVTPFASVDIDRVDVPPVPVPEISAPNRYLGAWLGIAAALLIAISIPVGWRATHSTSTRTPSQRVAASEHRAIPSEAIGRQSSAPDARPTPPPTSTSARKAPPSQAPVPDTPAESERAQLVLASNSDDTAPFSPSFASNASAVFFHEGTRESALMRGETSPEGAILSVTSIVDDGAKNYHVKVSPDGEQIAFDSDRDGVRGVYVASREGKDVRRVTGAGFAAVPSWSPDGQRLAFVRAEPGKPNVWNLWIHDLKTGEEKRLTNYAYGQPWGGSWFSDGRRICYSHEDSLYVLDLQTGAQRRYRSPLRGRLARTPAVSPDGKRVIFQVYRDGAWLLDLTDGSMRRVLADPTAEEFTWSPDGRRVAFHSERNGGWGLWVLGT